MGEYGSPAVEANLLDTPGGSDTLALLPS